MRYSYLFITIIFGGFWVFSCDRLVSSDESPDLQYDREYYIVNEDTVHVHLSHDIIAVYPAEDADPDAFNKLIRSYGLQPLRLYSHEPISEVPAQFVESGRPVIFRLPSNMDRRHFYSYYEGLNQHSFARHQLVYYSSAAGKQDPDREGWFYPTNKIVVKPAKEDFSVHDLEETFHVTLVSKTEQIMSYTFRDEQFRNGNPYAAAQSIYESGSFEYVYPSAYHEYTTMSAFLN
ncbi:hypothetical protein [Natronogracilivirga saccharolytica]|uniref:Lipoprotein n=1 Tax=Natronogracilivirga saccharolytica TaxID=2812953 RepID=A0A8J7S7V6_9BACT|nr:hypothetical protein [Natronogracilivirga saccharolytica]MBP3191843.1 hypothetical protein [Natronogracilivirga saccharolytica]